MYTLIGVSAYNRAYFNMLLHIYLMHLIFEWTYSFFASPALTLIRAAQNGLLLKFVVMHRWGVLSPSRDDSML